MKFLPINTDTAGFGWGSFLVLLIAALLPGVALFIWVAFFRKKRRRKYRRHRGESRRASAPMNPTLAQTGGLPPLRRRENASGEPKL